MSAPPIPAEVDVSHLPYTPIYRRRLLDSRTHAIANDTEWRAAFMLWLKAWDQKCPSGSLPDDDRELAHLAEVKLPQWRKVKTVALHGWERCDDGRLYHPVVTETVLDAWGKLERNRKRTQAATNARRSDNVTIDVTTTEVEGKGRDSPPYAPPRKRGGGGRRSSATENRYQGAMEAADDYLARQSAGDRRAGNGAAHPLRHDK